MVLRGWCHGDESINHKSVLRCVTMGGYFLNILSFVKMIAGIQLMFRLMLRLKVSKTKLYEGHVF